MRFALVVVFCALGFSGAAQNWKTVPEHDTFYFAGGNHNLKVIWIDSAHFNAGDSIFYFYKAIRTASATGCVDSMADTWLGASFLRDNDGIERYFNSVGDTILIHTNAALSTNWLMTKGQGSNLEYQATVSQVGTQTIDGFVDSIKVIALQALQNGVPVNDWYNNKELVLSKHRGWVKTLDMHRFPNAINVPYHFGASIDSQEHVRIDNSVKQINIADTQPSSRFTAGNEWVMKRRWGFGMTWGAVPATLFQHDSVISAQPIAGGVLVTLKTRRIQFPTSLGPDTTYIHTDTISAPGVTMLRDTVLPEYNWNLRDIHQDYLTTTNSIYYMGDYSVDTQCTNLFQISSNRIMLGSLGVIRDSQSQNCIRNPGWGLVYPADTRWRYLEGFGFNYEYFHWVSGDLKESLDEITYPYIKLGSCILGSKTVLSVDDEQEAENMVRVFPVPATDRIHIRFPGRDKHSIELFDMTGRKVFMQQSVTEETTIDVSGLSAGSYMVRVATADKVYVQKIIVGR